MNAKARVLVGLLVWCSISCVAENVTGGHDGNPLAAALHGVNTSQEDLRALLARRRGRVEELQKQTEALLKQLKTDGDKGIPDKSWEQTVQMNALMLQANLIELRAAEKALGEGNLNDSRELRRVLAELSASLDLTDIYHTYVSEMDRLARKKRAGGEEPAMIALQMEAARNLPGLFTPEKRAKFELKADSVVVRDMGEKIKKQLEHRDLLIYSEETGRKLGESGRESVAQGARILMEMIRAETVQAGQVFVLRTRLNAIVADFEQLKRDLREGRIDPDEANRRADEIIRRQQELERQIREAERRRQ